MATNFYFSQKVRSEQNLYEDLVIESLRMYGQDVYYIPRDILEEDRILSDDIPSQFNSSHRIEMYIENIEGFDGEGDLFTKFGVEIRDQATFVVSRRRWKQLVARYDNEVEGSRPFEGDLIYLGLTKKLFQVMAVEHESPFYQLSNLPVFKLRCELFEYSGEIMDTGVEEIDDIEREYSYTYNVRTANTDVNFEVGEEVTQTLADGTVMYGEVSYWKESTRSLSLVGVGSNDPGNLHTFVSGRSINSINGSVLIEAVTEENNISTVFLSGEIDMDVTDTAKEAIIPLNW